MIDVIHPLINAGRHRHPGRHPRGHGGRHPHGPGFRYRHIRHEAPGRRAPDIGTSRAALEYALGSPLLDAIAIGMQSVEEIDADVAMFEGDFSKMERLKDRPRKIMVHDWCEGCGRCAERCRQKAIQIVDGRAGWIPRSACSAATAPGPVPNSA